MSLRISLRRPRSGWHPAWSVVLTIAPPLYMSPYSGVAEAARDRAVEWARSHSGSEMTLLIGEMENALTSARLAWRHLVDNAADYDFIPEVERANRALIAKMLLTQAVVQTVEKAMEVVGGAAYFRRTGIERLLRGARRPVPPTSRKAPASSFRTPGAGPGRCLSVDLPHSPGRLGGN